MSKVTVVELAQKGRHMLDQLPVLMADKPGSVALAFMAIGQFAEAVDEVLGKRGGRHGTQAGGQEPPAESKSNESMGAKQ